MQYTPGCLTAASKKSKSLLMLIELLKTVIILMKNDLSSYWEY